MQRETKMSQNRHPLFVAAGGGAGASACCEAGAGLGALVGSVDVVDIGMASGEDDQDEEGPGAQEASGGERRRDGSHSGGMCEELIEWGDECARRSRAGHDRSGESGIEALSGACALRELARSKHGHLRVSAPYGTPRGPGG